MTSKSDETDEMKIKMLEALGKPDSEDKLYPSELNEHLLEQIKVISSDNNELRKFVFVKDQEIKELNKTISSLNHRIRDIISGSGPAISSKSAGIISAKITELCRQNRHLIAEMEGYKTKNSILERKVMHFEVINKEKDEAIKKQDICFCKDDPNPDELKELNIKLSSVNKKLYDSKNRNLELKNELLLATEILQQELGDKFTSIKDLHNDLAGWKGRAQQIMLLQAKVVELDEKLNGKHKDMFETKHKSQHQIIKELELKRKKEIDQVMKNVEGIKEENQELKKKLDAARARIRNLECDLVNLRQKMQTFLEKSKHDDMLINEQRDQIKNTELYYQELLKENTAKMKKMRNEIMEFERDSSNTDEKIDALRKQASEKARKIEELRSQLLRYEECSLQSVFFTPMKTATDNEINKLTTLIKTLNERLNTERQKINELESSIRKLKESKKRLERKNTALNEDIIQLNARKLSRSRCTLSREQICSTTQIDFKKKPFHTTVQKQIEQETVQSPETESLDTLDKDDLKFKLELSEEKNKILQDKFRMIEEEKTEDYNHLTDMIQTSKQLFNEALNVLQKEKCICR